MAQSNILIADKQALTAAGLTNILSEVGTPKIQQVQSTQDLFSALDAERYESLFIDYQQLPQFHVDNFDQLVDNYPQLRIAVVSADNNHATILEILKKQIPVFITKHCSEGEIKMAYQAMSRGEKFFCNKILKILVDSKTYTPEPKHEFLSEREQEIMRLIALGNSTHGIADKLFLSPHTISTHRKNIIRKLSIKSPTEFVVHAIDLGLVNFAPKNF